MQYIAIFIGSLVGVFAADFFIKTVDSVDNYSGNELIVANYVCNEDNGVKLLGRKIASLYVVCNNGKKIRIHDVDVAALIKELNVVE